MMRTFTRVLLFLSLAVLTAGPALALTAPVSHVSTVTAAPASASPLGALAAVVSSLVVFGMGIRIRDAGSLAKKFSQRAQAAAGDYKTGVEAAGADWQANTAASEENYKAGVMQAANDGRFGKGVQAAGAAKYTQRAGSLGAQRFPTGVAASEGDWSKATQPYLQTLSGLNLPPRRPKGDPANQARSQFVAQALRAQRLGK